MGFFRLSLPPMQQQRINCFRQRRRHPTRKVKAEKGKKKKKGSDNNYIYIYKLINESWSVRDGASLKQPPKDGTLRSSKAYRSEETLESCLASSDIFSFLSSNLT